MVHSTAVVHPGANLGSDVAVGPYSVIDSGVSIGAGCVVGPHVYLTGNTQIGERNVFHAGCVIGDAPQDVKYRDQSTKLLIGNDNVFREHVTIHRSNKLEEDTVIGSRCFLMAHCHVGHNTRVGDGVILANGSQLGGHAWIGNGAFLSANCLVHQFCRVGTLAMMQGGAAATKDLPPYTVARGFNGMCGLNVVGLRRAGLKPEERLELKSLYRFLFRGGRNLRQAVTEARNQFKSALALVMLDFLETGKRGFCSDKGVHDAELTED